jgi:hypothetical protein
VPKESLEVARKFFGYVEKDDAIYMNIAMFSRFGTASAEDNSDSAIMVGLSLQSAIAILNDFRTLVDVCEELSTAAHRSFSFVSTFVKDMFVDIKLADLQGYADVSCAIQYMNNFSRDALAVDTGEYILTLPKTASEIGHIFLELLATTPNPTYHLMTYLPEYVHFAEQMLIDEYFSWTSAAEVDTYQREYFDLRDENDNLMGWFFHLTVANLAPFQSVEYPYYIDIGPDDADLIERLKLELIIPGGGGTTHLATGTPDQATPIFGYPSNVIIREPLVARHIIPDWEALTLLVARGIAKDSGAGDTSGGDEGGEE